MTWEGSLQTDPSSPAYTVRVVYRTRGSPKVFVARPRLPDTAPHRWPDGSLCLYWPKEWHWVDTEPISGTIMLWAALWLEYYEVWKALGIWMGPSSHDEFPKEDHDS